MQLGYLPFVPHGLQYLYQNQTEDSTTPTIMEASFLPLEHISKSLLLLVLSFINTTSLMHPNTPKYVIPKGSFSHIYLSLGSIALICSFLINGTQSTKIWDNEFCQGSLHSNSNTQANDVEAQMHHLSSMIVWN